MDDAVEDIWTYLKGADYSANMSVVFFDPSNSIIFGKKERQEWA
jgi:hypothetical protein